MRLVALGEIVHLTATLGMADGGQRTTCVAAMVTGFNPDGAILCTVFSPIGSPTDAARRLPPTREWHTWEECTTAAARARRDRDRHWDGRPVE